jgi:hypothetical protein
VFALKLNREKSVKNLIASIRRKYSIDGGFPQTQARAYVPFRNHIHFAPETRRSPSELKRRWRVLRTAR